MIIRKTYPELQENHINPIISILNCYAPERDDRIASYNDAKKNITFPNGSRILFRYCSNDADAERFQGTEVDVLFIDEATHQSEERYKKLSACVRGVNNYPKRIYLTCNPGGEGHGWVKRLFVDRIYEPNENADDYLFIQSKVTDNKALMESNPDYIKQLESLPEDLRKAWLDGNWDIFVGQYFPEFRRDVHVIEPFPIPAEWRRWRAFDYGLDRLACVWCAMDSARNVYVYREVGESDLPISAAAKAMLDATCDNEEIYATYAPPDMWARSQETGKDKAYLFYEQGLTVTKASNDREAGWLAIKELLKVDSNGEPRLKIFNTCRELIKCLPALQRDVKRPTDCAVEPHEITHMPDALRYYAASWARPQDPPEKPKKKYSADLLEDYLNADEDTRKIMVARYGEPEI